MTRVPPSIRTNLSNMLVCELIDVDYDNNLDLVTGGTEGPNAQPTQIFWGDGTGFYSDANKTVLPAEPEVTQYMTLTRRTSITTACATW
jgi:hypothetical protein